MRALRSILIVALLLVGSCSRPSSLANQVGAAGGTAALIRDCQTILAEHQKSQKEIWSAGDTNLPPTIAALQPQIVQIASCEGLPMLDIQVSGGFSHRGLMVMLTNVPPGFVPRKSSWRVARISDGIFEYRE